MADAPTQAPAANGHVHDDAKPATAAAAATWCLHVGLARILAVRHHYMPDLARSEGSEGWCEACMSWVSVGGAA
jgi:hypothetical protein